MENEENDNIYIYSDADDTDDIDTSGPNYAQSYDIGNGDGDNGDGDNGDGNKDTPEDVSPFSLMIKVMFNPVEGWKSVRRSKITPEAVQSGCFYPLLALLAVSRFADLIYSRQADISSLLVSAVIGFVSLFFGYYCIQLLFKVVFPKPVAEQFDTRFGKNFVLISLSTLCLFFTVTELLPMLWAILIFLPLWTVYLICRGARFFKFPAHRQIFCTGMLSLVTVGVPPLLAWMLGELMPK